MENFEMILVDDGSPDECGKICDDYAARDSRIRVFHKENGGVTSARRFGVEHSRAEWITFVDSDDKLFPHALKTLLETAGRVHDTDLVEADMTKSEHVSENSSLISIRGNILCVSGTKYATETASHKMVWHPGPVAKLIRKSTLTSARALDVPAWINFGEDLLMCMATATKIRYAAKVGVPVYFYRSNPEGACATISRSAKYYRDWLRECERVLPNGLLGEFAGAWRAVARHYFIAMFLTCPDRKPRDEYCQKIVRELSAHAHEYSMGTRLCLVATNLPSHFQKPARSLLRYALHRHIKTKNNRR